MVNVVTGLEQIYLIMKECVMQEMATGRLLEDVNTLINGYRNDKRINEPVVWITQHPTYNGDLNSLSRSMELIVPFEFDAGVYDRDPEQGQILSQNLANRVILSVLKNWRHKQAEHVPGERIIKTVGIETYSPVGYVDIKGASSRLSVTGVILSVTLVIDWNKCIRPVMNNKDKYDKYKDLIKNE